MLGQLVSDAGGGYRIATTLINKFGRRWIQVAVILASFIIGLALFFEVGLVVVLPIIFIIARELDMPLMYLGIPMAATLNVCHAFLPPHPGTNGYYRHSWCYFGSRAAFGDHRRDSNDHYFWSGFQLFPAQGLSFRLPQRR
jgi:H+/gluconate symporter-like permease